ncbi:DUF1349 domain-containing protein [Cyclobacterium jeungdonense]|uniref:DUF1349 domain-containing protein n=1 Tax=Cyclobacterium jeungdonense TaxID=708087 RepID=A0ABT8C8V4_9BACT|nr:DUF1349 domain-containing protein [Cyclobacterium jeungdonense]MDN3689228.1 DUF1349 domain-containing protein [Cyclobacterium jeungdonense]
MPENQWDGFQWMNEPRQWSVEEKGLRLLTDRQTDFWRITHYDFVKNDGHFYYRELQGSFTCQLRFSGNYQDLYDQAGLMLRLDDTTWIKAGIEYVSSTAKASAVVTRDFSDWSIRELREVPIDFWVRAKRARDHVEISFSVDSENFEMLRLAYFPPSASLQVGIMAASPKGEGFETIFAPLDIKEG